MRPLTREFMRGRFDALVCGARAAQDLFESYLSKDKSSLEKQQERDRLFTVLKETKKTCNDVLKTLQQAVKEDE